MVVGLDSQNTPNVINTVSIGTLNATCVSPREVFKWLILSNCMSFICVHNHLSIGDLIPSEADKSVTGILCKVGKMLDIKLTDHLIINADKRFFSFSYAGLLNHETEEKT